MLIKMIAAIRYLVIIPIIGLIIAAAILFVFGGIGLIRFLIESVANPDTMLGSEVLPAVEVVEFVHQFLIGTVLFITAAGFYQLFIHEVDLPLWLKIENSEELETLLIGLSVVVLAVNFLTVVFGSENVDLLDYGAGIALPIAALALFIAARSRITQAERREKIEHGENVGEQTTSKE
jgi:uncharacterized membrane protein YqhA